MKPGMLTDGTGKVSASRVTYSLSVLIVMVLWAILSWKNGYMLDIDPGLVGVIASLALGKAGTSFADRPVNQRVPNE